MTAPPSPARRRKSARCPVCKERFKIHPRGRPPTFCSRSCRQRAYEQRKWSRPHPVELLARDIASVRVRDVIRHRKYGRPCSKLALSFRRRHQSRSDAVRLCALSRSEDSAWRCDLVRHPHPPSSRSVPPPRCSRNIGIRTPLPHPDGCAKGTA